MGLETVVKDNLKTIGKEKNFADLLVVFVKQTLATASTRQGSQVQILSHPPFFSLAFSCVTIVSQREGRGMLRMKKINN